MLKNKHLPAVGAGQKTMSFSLVTYGVLEELEVADVYIEELNNKIKDLESRFFEIENKG